jgi:ketosteroid isomerase-like protein
LKPSEILAAFLKAYEAKDIDAVARMLTDDVHLQDWNLEASGKEAVLAETKKNFLDAQHLQIEVRQLYEGTGCAAARLRIVVNKSVELEVVDTIAVNPDGKVSSIRAYKG